MKSIDTAPNNQTNPSVSTSSLPELTLEELDAAKSLQIEFDRLDRNRFCFFPDYIKGRYIEAAEAYVADPSDANLAKAKGALIDKELSPAFRDLRRLAHSALIAYVAEKVKPWATEVIERVLALARVSFDEVWSAEEDRQKVIAPNEPFVGSGIAEIARRPVTTLEQLLATCSTRPELTPDMVIVAFGHKPNGSAPLPAHKVIKHETSARPDFASMSADKLREMIDARGWTVPPPEVKKAELIAILEGRSELPSYPRLAGGSGHPFATQEGYAPRDGSPRGVHVEDLYPR